ncbi:MAG: IPT/TIG domain-containing protein [Nitrospirae bacterium]|nr:IPT/TIG domain-containing protein [Candidatus Manganitrophaceae bacterium]
MKALRLTLGVALLLFGSAGIGSAQLISSLSPPSGPSGTSVTLTGSGFGKIQGSSRVLFDGTPAAVIGWIDSEVVVTVPEGATSGPVVVTVAGEASNDNYPFRVVAPTSSPRLFSLSALASPPHSDATGFLVTMKGSGFGPTQTSSRVTFNGVPAGVIRWSDSEIGVAVPEGATTGPVIVTVNEAPSNGLPFIVFPYIAALTPSSGPAASLFTLEGAHFGAVRGENRVTFNDLPVPIVRWTDTQVTAAVPSDALTGPIVVTVNGVRSNANNRFAVRSPLHPMISSLFPRAGPSEMSVLIVGSGFGRLQESGTVTFNETPAAVLGWSDTEIIATVPPGATTGPVAVIRNGSASRLNPIFTATSESPFSLASITLAPEQPTLRAGQTASFAATGFFKNGASQRLSLATLAAGVGHTCAVLSEGTVRCWGENSFGQLGNGSTAPSSVPTRVRGIGSATAVAAGTAHTCVLLSEGRVACWGDNSAGQLGNGTNTGSALPVEVTGIRDAATITAGRHHACAVLSDGATMCWGSDADPPGSGGNYDSTTPVRVGGRAGSAATEIAGESHTCALFSEGAVSCWGDNTFGQLGNGSSAGSPTPVRVGDIGRATAIAAGSYHTCLVLSDGTVDCWGDGHSGQLGNGKNAGSGAPSAVADITTAAVLLWTSSDPSVATIDTFGRVTAHRPGLTTLAATSRGVSGTTTLLVEPTPSERTATRVDR